MRSTFTCVSILINSELKIPAVWLPHRSVYMGSELDSANKELLPRHTELILLHACCYKQTKTVYACNNSINTAAEYSWVIGGHKSFPYMVAFIREAISRETADTVNVFGWSSRHSLCCTGQNPTYPSGLFHFQFITIIQLTLHIFYKTQSLVLQASFLNPTNHRIPTCTALSIVREI